MTTALEQLIHALGKLPGIGEKSATRLAFFLLRSPSLLARELGEALNTLHEKTRLCGICCHVTERERCPVCEDTKRDSRLVCVVEEPSDVKVIEKTGVYRGCYHVLHGALSPLDGIGPAEIRVAELLRRLEGCSGTEVILATNADVEGDTTALYLSKVLRPLGVKVTRLASGIPVGGELEYTDPSTLSKALEERREFGFS